MVLPQTNQEFFEDYYVNQIGSGIPVYQPYSQYGAGLGNLLGSLFRRAIPLLRKGASVIGKQALSTGGDILEDVLDGKSVKNAARKRLKEGGENLAKTAARGIKRHGQSGSGRGSTKRRKTIKRKVIAEKRIIQRKKRNRNGRRKSWGPDFFN